MSCTSDWQPLWRPQNPALSGDKYGWENCAAYVGGYSADYSTCGIKQPTGAYIRSLTNEPIPDPRSPGLDVYQVRDALAKIGVTVTPFLRATWAEVIGWWEEGRYISLCGQYSVIQHTRFSGDPNFSGGHQIGVPKTLKAEDPLCDGRRSGIYKYAGEPYPVDLLRRFAGAFVVRSGGISQPIGLGYAQGFYTIAHAAPGGDMWHSKPGGKALGTVKINGTGHALVSTTDPVHTRYRDRPNGEQLTVIASLNLVTAAGASVDIDGHSPALNHRDQVYLVDKPEFDADPWVLRADCTALV